MSKAWIFQANPKAYDIDAALEEVEQIQWRVPQYTHEIGRGDAVVIWRSGADAGIVGVGRVLTDPQLQPIDPAEEQYWIGQSETSEDETKVVVGVVKTPFLSKTWLKNLPGFSGHKILTAPMGTVFALSDTEWDALAGNLAPPPPIADTEHAAGAAIPPPFAWKQRAKGVAPMPGGYNGCLESLRKVCTMVDEEVPTSSDVVKRLREIFGLSEAGAKHRESFLRKTGALVIEDNVCRVGRWARQWLDEPDDTLAVAALHARCQFIGEMLDAIREPKTTEELLVLANEAFGMGWDTYTQISNRRGWLQSAGTLVVTADGALRASESGLELLEKLVLYNPPRESIDKPSPPSLVPTAPVRAQVPTDLEELIRDLKALASNGKDYEAFERRVRDAFEFLGFEAEWLGGSGQTDVIADAVLGKHNKYRVIIDCKASSSGSVSDQQIDWVTLAEHKTKHDADFVALVAPKPSGERLLTRAVDHGVTVISVELLAGLCRQHARSPVDLEKYRAMFSSGGNADTGAIDEEADESSRLRSLARLICVLIREHAGSYGRLTARDLLLLLTTRDEADVTTEDEIQVVLDGFANPILGVLDGEAETGYRVTSSAATAEAQIRILAECLATTTDAIEGEADSGNTTVA